MGHKGSPESRLIRFLSDVSEGSKGQWVVRVVQRRVLEVRDSGNQQPGELRLWDLLELGRHPGHRRVSKVGSEVAGFGL